MENLNEVLRSEAWDFPSSKSQIPSGERVLLKTELDIIGGGDEIEDCV